MQSAASILAHMSWQAVFDVALSTVIIYYVITLVKETRAVQLAWGLVVLFLAAKFAEWLQFRTLGFLLGSIATPGGTIAIIILFYPEIRHALEEVGRGRLWVVPGFLLRREDVSAAVDKLVDAVVQLSQQRIGALMVLARDDGLSDVMATGTVLNAALSTDLLITIFYPGTPLHDGAVIVRGNDVVAAACMLPLSDNSRISSSLHTRHRAALGLAERPDAAVLVVSEEPGNISLAYDGRLLTALRPEVVRDKLLGLLQRDDSQNRNGKAGSAGGPKDGRKGKPQPEAGSDEPDAALPGPTGLAAMRAVKGLGLRAVNMLWFPWPFRALRGRARGGSAD